jgi:O-antigen/teichoic acid export membrane protein
MGDYKKTSLKQQGINAVKWSFLGTIINPIRNFIVSLILARLLQPEDFGVIGMAMVFASITDRLVDFGMSEALIREQKLTEKQKNTVFYINLIMGLFLALCMFLLAGLVADYFEMPVVKPIAQVLSTTFIFRGFNCVQSSQLKRELNFKIPYIAGIISGLVSGIIGIIMAFIGFGIWSIVISQILGDIIITVYIWFKSTWRPRIMFELSSVKELWQFGYKISLSRIIEVLFDRLDTLVIGKIFAASTLGFYYRAQSMNKLVVQYSFSAFSGVLFPFFSKIQDDMIRVRINTLKIIQLVSFTTFFFTGIMYICSSELINLLYGEKWQATIPLFKILGLFSCCFTLPAVCTTPIMSLGRSSSLLKLEIIKRILLSLSIPVGLYYGLYEYVYAMNIAILIGLLLNIILLDKVIQLSIKEQIKSILIYAIPCFFLIFLSNVCDPYIVNDNYILSLVVKSFLFSSVYITYSYIYKTDGFIIVEKLVITTKKRVINWIQKH